MERRGTWVRCLGGLAAVVLRQEIGSSIGELNGLVLVAVFAVVECVRNVTRIGGAFRHDGFDLQEYTVWMRAGPTGR